MSMNQCLLRIMNLEKRSSIRLVGDWPYFIRATLNEEKKFLSKLKNKILPQRHMLKNAKHY